MSKALDLREIFEPLDELIQAGLNGDLVFFVGHLSAQFLNSISNHFTANH